MAGKWVSRREMIGRVAGGCLGLAAAQLLTPGAGQALAAESTTDEKAGTHAQLPKTPGVLRVNLRQRKKVGTGKSLFEPIVDVADWQASETAIIICDMWSDHPCKLAAQRVGRLAPRMNEVVSRARDHGVAIIHAPSGGIEHYAGTPYRERMLQARHSEPPVKIQGWCYLDPNRESPLPVDDTLIRTEGAARGCDDPEPKPHPDFDRHEHPALDIIGYDGVSANGQEIYNFLEQEGRNNIVLMGVHTNMCVLGRPFGIRQMKYLGKNVVLCRDLTDALYDPRDRPYVSHTRGTEMIIEHIETHWCASLLGRDLTKVVPGSNDPQS